MEKNIAQLTQQIQAYQGDIDTFKNKFTGRKGALTQLFKELKDLSPEQRAHTGQELNKLKILAQKKIETLTSSQPSKKNNHPSHNDPTLPPIHHTIGSLHPLRKVTNKILDAFQSIGFAIEGGPEIETEWNNFSALNFPQNHPARDMQDTFFLDKKKKYLLRTHTSSVQTRIMSSQKPPFRFVVPGRVYRNEAISVRTHCMFHQIEAFYVNTNVSIAQLKATLQHLVQQLFGPDVRMRLRPSFFPFTEPSVEVDISCVFCKQKGCNICKYSTWIEILGAGMIDPNVLAASNINPKKYTGYALGAGIERIAMIFYKIYDIRLFTQNDIRFIKQFSSFQ